MIARVLGFPENEQVRVIGGSSSGLYGRRDAWDHEVDVEAALIAQEVGVPVRLQWSRADEFVWGQYRPPQLVELEAGLTDAGRVDGLRGQIYTAIRGSEPTPFITAMGLDATPYQLGPMPLEGFNAGPVLRTGYMRNVFTGYNIFALESFMDELAELANEDPVAFRLAHLSDERAIAVIEAATKRAGWKSHVGSSGQGIGLSFALYTKHELPSASYLAYVAEVDVDQESGQVAVTKVTCAIDAGLVVNPDGVTSQVEGGVIQGMSWALKEEVTFDRSIVTSHDWATYPILTFAEVPEIEVVIVNRPDLPSEGIGEPVTVPVAAALANAIYDATGARMRQLPLTPEQVKSALANG
jgi:CO/xanthine dehydrogenase Mo-binding subunit